MGSFEDAETLDLDHPFEKLLMKHHSPAARMRVELGAMTHVGKLRKRNEDHFMVARVARTMELLHSNLPEDCLPRRVEEAGYALVVADGIGGSKAGDVASRLAVCLVASMAMQRGKFEMRIDDAEASEVVSRMLGIFQDVDEELARRGQLEPNLEGMATTLTTAYLVGEHLFVFHVGDSRAYLARDGELSCLTRDQTLAQMLADLGQISSRDVERHSQRSVLTQALGGTRRGIEAQARVYELRDGDSVLVCSDGLTEHVSEAAINQTLIQQPDPQKACESLIEQALEGGGRDNITVALGRYSLPES